jgi:ubiquinone/menaquinone biosynthesis C-methylase UbiE
LRCAECDRVFPIDQGVPRLLLEGHSKKVQQSFTGQWRLRLGGSFENAHEIYCLSHEKRADDLEQKLGDALTDRSDRSPGDWFLDAGCGTGELIRHLARRHPHKSFVGIDFTDTIRDVARQQEALPNLDFVQANVAQAPFQGECFRAVISLGVLHHTADTRSAFATVADLVQPAGKLSVWLYPHPSELHLLDSKSRRSIAWYYRLRDLVFLGKAHLLPQKLLFWMLRISLLPVFVVPLPKIPPYTSTTRRQLYTSLVFVLFDDLVPAYQHRHTIQEVEGWFAEAGFSDFESGPPGVTPTHSLGAYTAVKNQGTFEPKRDLVIRPPG